jgi:hypothetical protein
VSWVRVKAKTRSKNSSRVLTRSGTRPRNWPPGGRSRGGLGDSPGAGLAGRSGAGLAGRSGAGLAGRSGAGLAGRSGGLLGVAGTVLPVRCREMRRERCHPRPGHR